MGLRTVLSLIVIGLVLMSLAFIPLSMSGRFWGWATKISKHVVRTGTDLRAQFTGYTSPYQHPLLLVFIYFVVILVSTVDAHSSGRRSAGYFISGFGSIYIGFWIVQIQSREGGNPDVRNGKYSMLVSMFMVFLFMAPYQTSGADHTPLPTGLASRLVSPMTLIIAFSGAAFAKLIPRISRGEFFNPRLVRYSNISVVITVGLLVSAQMLIELMWLCFAARYFIMRKSIESPIVYLRSFSDDSATDVMRTILVPSIGSRCTISGLIRNHESRTVLARRIHPVYHARLTEIGDDEWQEWVCTELDRCAAAVIDISDATVNVQWELRQCLKKLPPSRVLILSRESYMEEALDRVTVVRYELSRKGMKEASRHVRKWFLERHLWLCDSDDWGRELFSRAETATGGSNG